MTPGVSLIPSAHALRLDAEPSNLDSHYRVRCALGASKRIDLNSEKLRSQSRQKPLPPDQMKKAISLDVRLWIEGEDEPAHDFSQSTTQAVRDIIEAGAAKYPALAITIRSIREKS